MRKVLILGGATAALATPAMAEDKTTIDYVLEKGIVMQAMGMDIPITYSDDGTYVASVAGMGDFPGSWRRDGDSLCTENDMQPETCNEYPAGKGPGDSFEMTSEMGTATITINE